MAQTRIDGPPNRPIAQEPADGDPQITAVGMMIAQALPPQTAGVGGAQIVGLPPAIGGALSPEMLLAYMRSNLEGLDGQIADALDRMTYRRERSAQLDEVANRLRELKNEAANNVPDDGGRDNDGVVMDEARRAELEQLLTTAGVPSAEIDRMLTAWGSNAHTEEIDTALQRVTDELGRLNNENEYESLVLNDLISKRSNLIQMVSKMMSSMDETAKAVIQNMR